MAILVDVDESRKRVLLIAACILAARKHSQWDGRHSPGSESVISDANALAERIMEKIDSHWPARPGGRWCNNAMAGDHGLI